MNRVDVFPDLFVRIQGWYAAFNAGDGDPLHADTVPAARAAVAGLWASLEPELHPTELHVAADGTVVVDVRQVVRDGSGRIVAEGAARHVYRLDADLVQEMSIRPPGTRPAP